MIAANAPPDSMSRLFDQVIIVFFAIGTISIWSHSKIDNQDRHDALLASQATFLGRLVFAAVMACLAISIMFARVVVRFPFPACFTSLRFSYHSDAHPAPGPLSFAFTWPTFAYITTWPTPGGRLSVCVCAAIGQDEIADFEGAQCI